MVLGDLRHSSIVDGESVNRVVVANLDSVEQSRIWTDVTRRVRNRSRFVFRGTMTETLPTCQSGVEEFQRGALTDENVRLCIRSYCENLTDEKNRRLLTLFPQYENIFAGILRSAYLYAENIVVPINQIFDGIFFLSFGPQRISAMLSNHEKDEAVVLISGRADDVEHCIKNFFFERLESSSLYTLATKYYSALGIDVKYSNIKTGSECCKKLTKRLDKFEDGKEDIVNIVADAFTQYVISDSECAYEGAKASFDFLAMRLREWIDAVHNGIVAYENQLDLMEIEPQKWFNECLNANLCRSYAVLQEKVKGKNDGVSFLELLKDEPKRSVAFDTIDGYCEKHKIDKEKAQFTKDWYQHEYNRALAQMLQADLISVYATTNSFARADTDRTSEKNHFLMFDGEITTALGKMPHQRFSDFCYGNQEAIARWRRCNRSSGRRANRDATRDISYAVSKTIEEHGFKEQRKDLLTSLFIVAVTTTISAWLNQEMSNNVMPMFAVIIAVCVVNLLPTLLETLRWFSDAHSSQKTIVYMVR